MSNEKAPEGMVYVCAACGKVSRYRYGFAPDNSDYDSTGRKYSSAGWDESCMMNAELAKVADLPEKTQDRVKNIAPA